MKTSTTIQYREAANQRELELLFHLRHAVYKEDKALKNMLSARDHDLNAYDLNALHFGAFHGKKPIAYIRLAVPSETHQTAMVRKILKVHQISLDEKKYPFPFQHYFPDARWSENFLIGLKEKKIGEVGRLAIHPAYRNGGLILDGLFLSFIAYCRNIGQINIGFGSCTLLLERYYRKFGFQRAANCQPFTYKELPEAVIVCFDERNSSGD